MKKIVSPSLVLALYSFALPLHAQTPQSPRARALAEQQRIYGNENPIERRFGRVMADFQETPGFEVDKEWASFRRVVLPEFSPQMHLAIMEFVGGFITPVYAIEVARREGKKLSLLRSGASIVICVDGLARMMVTMSGREATLSPILTLAQIHSGLITPPNQREALPNISLEESGASLRELNWYTLSSWAEFATGFIGGLVSTAFPSQLPANPRLRRLIRIGGPLLFVDSAARMVEIEQGRAPTLLPLVGFLQRNIADQGVYGDLTVRDLSEVMLRKMGFHD